MGGGAWPFLVGGVTCLVNSDNGRDLDWPVWAVLREGFALFGRTTEATPWKFETKTGP